MTVQCSNAFAGINIVASSDPLARWSTSTWFAASASLFVSDSDCVEMPAKPLLKRVIGVFTAVTCSGTSPRSKRHVRIVWFFDALTSSSLDPKCTWTTASEWARMTRTPQSPFNTFHIRIVWSSDPLASRSLSSNVSAYTANECPRKTLHAFIVWPFPFPCPQAYRLPYTTSSALTGPVCPLSVSMHIPVCVFHTRIVMSSDPGANVLCSMSLSDKTSNECPVSVFSHRQLLKSHNLIMKSANLLANVNALTAPLCPMRLRSHSRLARLHNLIMPFSAPLASLWPLSYASMARTWCVWPNSVSTQVLLFSVKSRIEYESDAFAIGPAFL